MHRFSKEHVNIAPVLQQMSYEANSKQMCALLVQIKKPEEGFSSFRDQWIHCRLTASIWLIIFWLVLCVTASEKPLKVLLASFSFRSFIFIIKMKPAGAFKDRMISASRQRVRINDRFRPCFCGCYPALPSSNDWQKLRGASQHHKALLKDLLVNYSCTCFTKSSHAAPNSCCWRSC